MVKNWLITGGCGFIGTSLIAKIIQNSSDASIIVLDNLTVGSREDLKEVCDFNEVNESQLTSGKEGVQLVVGDIKDYETVVKSSHGIECIVHLAANTGVGPSVEDPRADMENNVLGVFNVLEAARQNKVGKVIFASSGAPLGEVTPPIHEEIAPHPVSPYGASKLAGEAYCSAYSRTFGVKTIALRFGNVYGTRSVHKDSVVAKFFKRALKGEILEIYGDGKQTRDFIYIDDLLQAVFLASETELGGEVFQIATHKETTVNEIATAIKDIIETETDLKVNVVYSAPRLGDVTRNFSDISKAKNMLGYNPEYTLEKGLKEVFNYFYSFSNSS